jgi:hypothetical protein
MTAKREFGFIDPGQRARRCLAGRATIGGQQCFERARRAQAPDAIDCARGMPELFEAVLDQPDGVAGVGRHGVVPFARHRARKTRYEGRARGTILNGSARGSGAVAKNPHFQGDACEQRQDDARGDELNRALNGGAADKADGIKECAQIADIECGFLAIEPDIGEGTLCAFFGGPGQQLFKFDI